MQVVLGVSSLLLLRDAWIVDMRLKIMVNLELEIPTTSCNQWKWQLTRASWPLLLVIIIVWPTTGGEGSSGTVFASHRYPKPAGRGLIWTLMQRSTCSTHPLLQLDVKRCFYLVLRFGSIWSQSCFTLERTLYKKAHTKLWSWRLLTLKKIIHR